MRSALQSSLRAAGMAVQAFASAEVFLKSGQQHQAACLILDVRLPGISGLELQAKLSFEHRRIPIIFITANGNAEMRTQALQAGALQFFLKPFDNAALLESVRVALEGWDGGGSGAQ